MSEFKVRVNNVRAATQEQNDIAKQMLRLEEEIRQVQDGLSFEIAQKERIRQRLKNARNTTSSQAKGIYKATKALNQIADTYETTEANLTGHRIAAAKLEPLTSAADVLQVIAQPDLAAKYVTGPSLILPGLLVVPLDTEAFKTESQTKFGIASKNLKLKEKDKESWYSKNKPKLKDSKIKAFKIVDQKWKSNSSLIHKEGIIGEQEGSHASGNLDVLKQELSAEIYGGLYYTDPTTGKKKLRMAAGVEAGYTFAVLSLQQEAQLGDKYLNAYVKTEETFGKVEVKGDAVIGLRDADGKFNPTAHGKVSAEAIAAEASIKGGVNVLGADVGLKASVNIGIGAHAEFGLKDGVFSADIGASCGIGGSVKLEVDLSGMVDTVSGAAEAAWTEISGWFK